MLWFAELASASQHAAAGQWLHFFLLQVMLGPIVGGLIGLVGAKLIDRAVQYGWITSAFQAVAIRHSLL